MQRRCQVIRLHAESCEEYIRYHKQVWPTVLATISACNIKNYSIYLHEDLLVAYFEYHGEDYISDMAKMVVDHGSYAKPTSANISEPEMVGTERDLSYGLARTNLLVSMA
jgi:L-rhamnose mutarotase